MACHWGRSSSYFELNGKQEMDHVKEKLAERNTHFHRRRSDAKGKTNSKLDRTYDKRGQI